MLLVQTRHISTATWLPFVSTATLPHIHQSRGYGRSNALRSCHACCNVLGHGPATHANRADEVSIVVKDRLPTSEDYQSSVRFLNAKEVASWLRAVKQAVGWEQTVDFSVSTCSTQELAKSFGLAAESRCTEPSEALT